jgi:hypothetical protein
MSQLCRAKTSKETEQSTFCGSSLDFHCGSESRTQEYDVFDFNFLMNVNHQLIGALAYFKHYFVMKGDIFLIPKHHAIRVYSGVEVNF